MKTLDEIAIKFGTDKATQHIGGSHGYCPHYDRIFTPIRESEIKLVEIGVGGGESIQTWIEYFSSGHIYGIDITRNTNPWNTAGAPTHPRYTFTHGDQGDATWWPHFFANCGEGWDVVIDDGSHYAKDVIASWGAMWPKVRSGGFYCIEDLAVAYGGHPFTAPGVQNHMDFIRDRLDDINRSAGIRSLVFTKELAIFQKE